jgi:NAD(P)-dependent dehydrogenase (short-subunit alcohol dehydrogenase family)
MNIADRVAIVTGGGSGIGQATAVALAAEGASVVVVDLDATAGANTVDLITAADGNAIFFRADVASPRDAMDMVRIAEERFGGLDILHNNAGLMFIRPGFAEQATEDWLRMMDVNFGGVMLGTHAAIPAMKRRGGGVIVQSSSVAGLVRYPASPVYAASKAAIVSFTRALGVLRDQMNIRVNCVCPGSVDTPGVRANRAREAAEGAVRTRIAPVRMPPEHVAQAVLQCIRDDDLAGAVLKIMPDEPAEVLTFPDWGTVR